MIDDFVTVTLLINIDGLTVKINERIKISKCIDEHGIVDDLY